LINGNTDAGVDDGQSSSAKEFRPCINGTGGEQKDGPADGRSDERRAPPTSEDQSEENERWNHPDSSLRPIARLGSARVATGLGYRI